MAQSGAITSISACVAVKGGDAESATWAVKLKVPAAVGVPLMTPVAESDNPGGRVPDATDQWYGRVPLTAASAGAE